MEQYHTAMSELFAQLGLPNEANDMQAFIKNHAGLAANIKIESAGFWTPAQAAFLKTALAEDGEWAEVIDQLSNALR